jgi:uncharacterized protein
MGPERAGWASIIGVLLFYSGCHTATREPDHQKSVVIRVATDGLDNNPLIEALKGPLQSYFPSKIETVQNDLPTNARLIEESGVELAIIPVNVAYVAYTQGWGGLPRPHSKLRGIAALYAIPLHLIATESSGIRRWRDIRGKRVAVGPLNSTTQVTVKMILEGLGISLTDIDAQWVNGDAAVKELRGGRVAAVFHRGNDPPSTIPKLLQIPGAGLVPISRSETEIIRSRHPFLHPVLTPQGKYGSNPEIETIGVDSVVVCRDDLPEDLVYSITRSVFETLAGPTRLPQVFQQVDLRQVQATQIPLHAGAARYFRERELFQ